MPILFSVTVNLETSVSKLGRVLLHNNTYIRSTLLFTKSSAKSSAVKMVSSSFSWGKMLFLILQHSLISINHKIPCK